MADLFQAGALRERLRAALVAHRTAHPEHADITFVVVPPGHGSSEARLQLPPPGAGEAHASAEGIVGLFPVTTWLVLLDCRWDVPSLVHLGGEGVTVQALD